MSKKRDKANRKERRRQRREMAKAIDAAFAKFEAKRKELAPDAEAQERGREELKRAGFKISDTLIARSKVKRRRAFTAVFEAARPYPKVLPPDYPTLAMDEAITEAAAWASQALYNGAYWEGTTFLGYPYLSELAQRPEYRRIFETIATEMTRKWIEFKAVGEEDKNERIKQLTEYMDRLKVRDRFREIAAQDGMFGRAHLFLQIGPEAGIDDRAELKQSIGGGNDDRSRLKVSKETRLERLQVVEPIWCYPAQYESVDPLKPTWYNPDQWFVQGKQVHVSRLLTFVGREVPDLLKPAYQFGGLSMSQMAKPYVDNWLRNRQSVADMISAFSVMVLATNMAGLDSVGGEDFLKRVDLFNNLRDNRSSWVVDKNTEDVKNVSAPLGTLDVLQAQSQEHICSVSGIPVVKYTGIQPAGLNADSDGVIRVWYDNVAAYQEKFFREKLTRVVHFCMLSLWGQVDEGITFDFVKLHELTDKEAAEVRKVEAETDSIYVNDVGAISPEEVRTRLAGDKDSPYHGLDPDDLPEQPAEETAELEPGEVEPAAETGDKTKPAAPALAAQKPKRTNGRAAVQ